MKRRMVMGKYSDDAKKLLDYVGGKTEYLGSHTLYDEDAFCSGRS